VACLERLDLKHILNTHSQNHPLTMDVGASSKLGFPIIYRLSELHCIPQFQFRNFRNFSHPE